MKYRFRSKCLCCNKRKLNKIIDLGLHSFADRFVPKKKLNVKDPKYQIGRAHVRTPVTSLSRMPSSA